MCDMARQAIPKKEMMKFSEFDRRTSPPLCPAPGCASRMYGGSLKMFGCGEIINRVNESTTKMVCLLASTENRCAAGGGDAPPRKGTVYMKRNVLASMATSCICATALAAGLMPGVAFAASPVHILAEHLQPASDTPAMVAGTVDVGGQYMLLMSEADMSFALSTQTNTAALVGINAKATGQLDVPAAVTADEASYTVDAIGSEKACGGGFTARSI